MQETKEIMGMTFEAPLPRKQQFIKRPGGWQTRTGYGSVRFRLGFYCVPGTQGINKSLVPCKFYWVPESFPTDNFFINFVYFFSQC